MPFPINPQRLAQGSASVFGSGVGFEDSGPPVSSGVSRIGFSDPGNPQNLVGTTPSGFTIGGRSFSRLAPDARWDNVAQHAIVLEGEPAGADSRLVFESFPGELEESYRLKSYRKMGGHRMPQPQFATYQGGDWGPFPLTLVFRAGINDASGGDPYEIVPRDIETILIMMEQKVNWLIALAFPLNRTNRESRRIQRAAIASIDFTASDVSQSLASTLRRFDPPFVMLCLGTWKVIRGYLKGISWTWKGPWHPISGRPYGAEVRMEFQPLMQSYPTWNTIRTQAGRAGASGPLSPGPLSFQSLVVDTQRVIVTNRLRQNTAAASVVAGGQ